jgi:glycogen(starch) synthase
MTAAPTVSVVINTDARAASLRKALESLRYLRYPQFEVVVVLGPTRDGTHEMLAAWQGQIKIGSCPRRNLSQSRNIGIEISSGDLVAFLDDDAIPEPEWLDDVVPAFSDPEVGVAGGFLHDHTGKDYQWRFGTVNRFATADQSWDRATPEYNFPFSLNVPHVIGANSIFRRKALIEVGGFDEEFEYYLDETDLICRIVDHGWKVAQLDRAFVHHKFMPSHIRNQHRILTSWYSLIKNKAYFSLIHGRPYVTLERIIAEITGFIDEYRGYMRSAIEHDILTPEAAERFEQEADQALHDGMERGFRGWQQLADAQRLAGDIGGFLPFRSHLPAARQRCFVLLSALYPPEAVGGIGRYVHILARAIARLGHQVHVLTRGEEHDRVDFEDGVWVHRCVVRDFPAPEPGCGADAPLPAHIWNHSMTMLAEAREIAARRPVDCVHAPIWDVEGIAFLRDGTLPLVTGLHTTLSSYLDSNPKRRLDDEFMQTFVEPVLAAERELLMASDGLLANSEAIIEEIEEAYDLHLDSSRTRVVPHGIEDWYALPAEPQPPLPEGMVRLVFIGRLEARKGIGILLSIAPDLLSRYPHLRLDIVGNDQIPSPDGRTWREAFEAEHAGLPALTRIAFHGEVSDERLRGFYRAADIVLAPSHFESFGLVHLEAMMMGKPVIGCRTGGMSEVIEDGRTGLLAEPADTFSLHRCIERLLSDDTLRQRLGEAARAKFLDRFTAARMAEQEVAFMTVMSAAVKAGAGAAPPGMAGLGPERASPAKKRRRHPTRIAIINGVLTRNDAISADVANTWRYLADGTGWDVSVLTRRNDFCDVPARLVAGLTDMLRAPEFLSADLLIYHFGFFNPLYDAMVLGNGRARQAVFFHNITPAEFVVPRIRPDVVRSFEQLNHLHYVDRLWPVSRVNAELLIELGFDPARIEILPGAVTRPAVATLRDKAPVPVELLFLGRIVPFKGVGDLLEAIVRLRDRPLPPFRLRIVGNLEYSDSAYCETVRRAVASHGLGDVVEFIGTVDDDHRDRLLHAAHILAIPSYHEGFCKPVIEGLRAGCVPVGYAAYNLKYVAEGVCRMVSPGDVAALAEALAEVIGDVSIAIVDPAARLRLDRGRLTAPEFAIAAQAVFDQYRPKRIAALTCEHAARLLSPEFSLPNDTARMVGTTCL